MKEEVESSRKLLEVLEEILKWTKFQGMQNVKVILESELDDISKKLIYELSDGRSSPEIAKIAGVASKTVRNHWKKWCAMGIMEIHPDYKKRYRKVFSLEEVGIQPPETESAEKKNEEIVEEVDVNEQEE
ncbi:MAG: hypothetical protein HXS52_02115 [Theionarchaea archaeon]|nr:hypothetical protein [Theionarchaea archaeon]